MTLTDHHIEELLQLCKTGHQSAQLEVYNRYYKAMYNTALRITKNTAEAEDVMQESFLSAFTKLDSYKGDSTFGSWLKRIVVNNSLNSYQKKNRMGEVPLENDLYWLSDNDNPEDCNSNTSEVKRVLRTIATLKDNYRVSLTLHLIEGYDYEEVSDIMKISYANCRTMVSRAKESLRKKLVES